MRVGESIEGVVEIVRFGASSGAPDLVVEIPHGATAAEYRAHEALLTSPLPADLIEFFHVNTDAGAPEVARELAGRLANGSRRVDVVRCCIPRTFIDCNRVLDQDAATYRAGGVTPGVPPWISTDSDHRHLRAAYAAYQRAVSTTIGTLPAHGMALLLHTYAPRSVDVDVNLAIVPSLRHAYEAPERWPLRPEVDLIARDPDGRRWLTDSDVEALRGCFARHALPMAENATYPLHPVTTAWAHTQRLGRRAVCLEVRRDLLGEFTPMRPVSIDPLRVVPVAAALASFFGARLLAHATAGD